MYKFVENKLLKQKLELDGWYERQFANRTVPQSVSIETDIPYIQNGKDCHKMDICYPKERAAKLPVVFDFHGGGLVSCDRRFNRWFCGELAGRGCLVFCIDYPLVPQSDVYGILKDAYAGVCHAYRMLERYAGDSERVFLCGDSAGGFVGTYLAAVQNVPAIAASLGIKTEEMRFAGLAAISGMFYSSRIDSQGIFFLRRDFYGESCRKHPFWKYVNPENPEILENLPPVLCVTSKGDFLREYTLKFVGAMKKAGLGVVLKDYANDKLKHDFVCMTPDEKETAQAIDLLASFFQAGNEE
ncbi:MAG: alpha/beta hydrolase [Clostridia bacterium]|nr:alpha/beta hydrolase [Clostridia bacterium]